MEFEVHVDFPTNIKNNGIVSTVHAGWREEIRTLNIHCGIVQSLHPAPPFVTLHPQIKEVELGNAVCKNEPRRWRPCNQGKMQAEHRLLICSSL